MLLLLAVALTVLAGPLGRPTAEHSPSGEVFQPASVASFIDGSAR